MWAFVFTCFTYAVVQLYACHSSLYLFGVKVHLLRLVFRVFVVKVITTLEVCAQVLPSVLEFVQLIQPLNDFIELLLYESVNPPGTRCDISYIVPPTELLHLVTSFKPV